MVEKEKTNFLVPAPLMREFRKKTANVGAKQHWTVFSAAILMLLESPPEKVAYYVSQVGASDYGDGTYDDLISEAESGRLNMASEKRLAAKKRNGNVKP